MHRAHCAHPPACPPAPPARSDTFAMVQRQMAEAVGGSAAAHRLLHDDRKPPAEQTLAAAGVGADSVMYWVPDLAAAGKEVFAEGTADSA